MTGECQVRNFRQRKDTLEPFRPPSWSLSLSPHTNTLVLIVAADSSPVAFFLIRLTKQKRQKYKSFNIKKNFFLNKKESNLKQAKFAGYYQKLLKFVLIQ